MSYVYFAHLKSFFLFYTIHCNSRAFWEPLVSLRKNKPAGLSAMSEKNSIFGNSMQKSNPLPPTHTITQRHVCCRWPGVWWGARCAHAGRPVADGRVVFLGEARTIERGARRSGAAVLHLSKMGPVQDDGGGRSGYSPLKRNGGGGVVTGRTYRGAPPLRQLLGISIPRSGTDDDDDAATAGRRLYRCPLRNCSSRAAGRYLFRLWNL